MAIFNAANTNPGVLIANVVQELKNHRAALDALNDRYAWSSGISAADLQAAPISMTAADANALLAAIADAHAEYLIHTTGTDPSHPPAGPAYVYAASQNQVIGAT
jgi:hypothetical protein